MLMRIGYKLTRSISDRALINVAGSHPDTLSDRSAPRPSSPHIEQAYGSDSLISNICKNPESVASRWLMGSFTVCTYLSARFAGRLVAFF